MGPLFSLAILFVLAIPVGLGAFALARIFRVSNPFLTALSFLVGCGVGGAAAVVLAAGIIGVGATLTSSSQAAKYFGFLGIISLSSGLFAAWCCKHVLTIYSTRAR